MEIYETCEICRRRYIVKYYENTGKSICPWCVEGKRPIRYKKNKDTKK